MRNEKQWYTYIFTYSSTRMLALLSVLSVILLSFSSAKEKHLFHTKGRFHLAGHVAAFFLITLFSHLNVRSFYLRIVLVIATDLFGVILEWGEHLVFGTPLEYMDILVDCLGVLAGVTLTFLITHFTSNTKV